MYATHTVYVCTRCSLKGQLLPALVGQLEWTVVVQRCDQTRVQTAEIRELEHCNEHTPCHTRKAERCVCATVAVIRRRNTLCHPSAIGNDCLLHRLLKELLNFIPLDCARTSCISTTHDWCAHVVVLLIGLSWSPNITGQITSHRLL